MLWRTVEYVRLNADWYKMAYVGFSKFCYALTDAFSLPASSVEGDVRLGLVIKLTGKIELVLFHGQTSS